MNLNVKLDGEEEQPLQYVNRFAFNIPSGAAAFNVNIVNPGLSNQSYILNPMNSVGQGIVTYQPQMALQSYIALPTEAEGNILHSLPVGVPVPVGLPVSTGLLQNNFVNTSIIIGNEDCNSQGVIKSTSTSLNPENEIKVNYIEKPVEQLDHKPNGVELQNIRVASSPPATPEGAVKKPCPLEMSIKAANIDMEFEKCEPGIPVLLENCHAVVEKRPVVVEHVPLESQMKGGGVLKVPFEVAAVESPLNVEMKESQKKMKTEITWENNNKQGSVDNGFTESLICEVEEANDDDDDEEDDDEEGEEEEEEEEEGEEADEEEEEEEEEGEEGEESETGVENTNSTSVNSSEDSSEESDSLPLSMAFRRDKHASSKSNKSQQEEKTVEGGKSKQKKNRSKQRWKDSDEKQGNDWSESDDDVLNLKRIKNEFDYKCFFEPKTAKSSSNSKADGLVNKFVRVRSCCSKRECGKKVAVQDQRAAHKHFYNLETNLKREAYLMNCIEYVQKHRHVENAKEKGEDKFLSKLEEDANIQLEIENESNGNQKLSDEIQKAINESLKDCAANESREGGGKTNEGEAGCKVEGVEKPEKNSWNFYIVIDRCRRKVCLQFLLKLFQISKSRIRQLQKKIISGSPLSEESNQKSCDVWEVAKEHLNEVESVECFDCKAIPRHRFLTEKRSKEDLFSSFRNFYFHKLGKGPTIKYASYRRFLEKKTSLSFCTNQEGICSECEESKKQEKRKQSRPEKTKKGKEGKKQWVVKTDSEDRSSDDEPLLKRKKLKLKIPLKAMDGKASQKRNLKKDSTEKGSKGKSKQSGSRGRDVWSLMLLHLETMPYKECKSCVSKKRHRFLDPSLTTLSLFEDYRKYFLKETNSELGLGFTMYEKYFNRNCNYLISDVDVNSPNCPGCAIKS